MDRKQYNGLEAEFVSFGDKDIAAIQIWKRSRNCELGSVSEYQTDINGNPMPFGVCWDEDDGYSLRWTSPMGGVK